MSQVYAEAGTGAFAGYWSIIEPADRQAMFPEAADGLAHFRVTSTCGRPGVLLAAVATAAVMAGVGSLPGALRA